MAVIRHCGRTVLGGAQWYVRRPGEAVMFQIVEPPVRIGVSALRQTDCASVLARLVSTTRLARRAGGSGRVVQRDDPAGEVAPRDIGPAGVGHPVRKL